MKTNIVILLLLLSVTAVARQKQTANAKSQPVSATPRHLRVGERVPEVLIPRLINYKSSTAKLSDFKDQLLILDFWSVNCSGCIAALPKMQALQDKFGSQVMILPVTYDQELITVNFWKKNRYTKGLSLPSVVNDKILSAWFKHQLIPHEAWIYKGVVVGLTASDYVTEENIRQVLDGKKVNWPVKNDFLTPYDYGKPTLQVDKNQYDQSTPVKYAAVYGYREGGKSQKGSVRNSAAHTTRNYFTNFTVPMAYYTYWHELRDPDFKKGLPFFPDPNRVILEVKDPKKYASIEETGGYLDQWHRHHLFCYESVNPDTGQTNQAQSEAVIKDLDHLLGLHGRFENRKIKCLVLVAPAAKDTSVSLKNVVSRLNQLAKNPPVIDQTGLHGSKEPELSPESWNDLTALRKALQVYGIALKEEERELEMFVLTETN